MSRHELDKTYDPIKVEKSWYDYWLKNSLFHADEHTSKEPYTIVIPPPNVTGMLTMGHILNNTIQDLLIRWKKMQGHETLWMPGMDHAGIATQSKVEALLDRQGTNRHELGRETFLHRVWQWKEQYGGIILEQLKRLGAACDWERERFTMDEELTVAVRKVFVQLYEKGLIYRGHRLINWSPKANTALSEEEVNYSDEQGTFWHIAYPIKGEQGEIVVATTRPETMLGDTAVAVHPEDERYQNLVGKKVILPLLNREIPIIADEHADPEKGSGAVKITPAHDFNDFQVGLTHDLEQISVIAPEGKMTEKAGAYAGMDRFEAREKIVNDLKELNLLRGTEEKVIPVPRCYRTNCIIEPVLSDQWFVKMKPLAEPAIKAVKSGKIRFHPKHWEETYFHWMENIRDWCISRQIWWGHRVPAWYCENGHITISMDDPEQCHECSSTDLSQDDDVLDTWFSSWLWPFSTLGWPKQTQDLKVFFPTNTLVTGPDIIFFWVARMIMASLEFMGDIPFEDVYFNGMIRDKDNRKMSKSLGNSPDPLWLIEGVTKDKVGSFGKTNPTYKNGVPAYGADAVRLTMVYLTPLGGDIRFDHTLVEMGQKFCNKLWNAARFVLMNIDQDFEPRSFDQLKVELADQWILSRLNRVIESTDIAFSEFRFSEATHRLYDFVWSEFCDWYLEFIKQRLYDDDIVAKTTAQSVVIVVLQAILRLLHPIMPFITEHLWNALEHEKTAESIIIQTYPTVNKDAIKPAVEMQMDLIQKTISALRNIRGEMNIPPTVDAGLVVNVKDPKKQQIIIDNERYIKKLARISNFEYDGKKPELSASSVVQGIEFYMPLEDLIDVDVEKSRLKKEIARLEKQLLSLNTKLADSNFLSRAPKEIVEKEQKKKQTFEENLKKLTSNMSMLNN